MPAPAAVGNPNMSRNAGIEQARARPLIPGVDMLKFRSQSSYLKFVRQAHDSCSSRYGPLADFFITKKIENAMRLLPLGLLRTIYLDHVQ